MSLDIEDGFNFTIGEWIAELTITLTGIIVIIAICAIVYGVISLYEYINDRRVRK